MRPADKEFAQWLNEKFIPVRIVNMKGVDLNVFQFDYDLTFAVLLMNADGIVYSRFGTMDATQTMHRMSIAGLKNAMREVLDYHDQRGKTPARQWGANFSLQDIPAFARSRQASEACYHCHYVGGFRFKQLRQTGSFRKDMIYQYPLPENIGITLDRDENRRIRTVHPGSPAHAAELRAGDLLLEATLPGRGDMADPLLIFTAADLQFALHHVGDENSLRLLHRRTQGGVEQTYVRALLLPPGWRKTDVSWRSSQATFPPTVGIWGEALTDEQKTQRGLAPGQLALKVTFFFNGPEWRATRGDLKLNDVITGLNGESLPSMNIRQFHSHFRLTYNLGDTVTLNALRGDRKIAIEVPCTNAGEG